MSFLGIAPKCRGYAFLLLPKRRHRETGELSAEPTEGEQLEALDSFESFPFRHGLRRDTFPASGDSFLVAINRLPIGEPVRLLIYFAYVFFTISISSSHIFSRLWMLMNSLLPWKL